MGTTTSFPTNFWRLKRVKFVYLNSYLSLIKSLKFIIKIRPTLREYYAVLFMLKMLNYLKISVKFAIRLLFQITESHAKMLSVLRLHRLYCQSQDLPF